MILNNVVIGLGSNLGDRMKYLSQARTRLQTLALGEFQCSDIYESLALGGEDHAHAYLNQVVAFACGLDPVQLLNHLKGFERVIGRRHRGHWMSREIDLDILLFNDELIVEQRLIIPHVGLSQRQFMLRPLCDLMPLAYHPSEGILYTQMLSELVRFEGDLILRKVGN